MFHSRTPENIQQSIISSLNDPSSVLRVVIATAVLGQGVDFARVRHVVNYSPPWEMETYMEACGRALEGRLPISLPHPLPWHTDAQPFGQDEAPWWEKYPKDTIIEVKAKVPQ